MLLILCVWTHFLLARNFANGNSIAQYDRSSLYTTVPKYIPNNRLEDVEEYGKVAVRCSGGAGSSRRRMRPAFDGRPEDFSPFDREMFYKQGLSDFLSKILPQNGNYSQYGPQNPSYPLTQYPNGIQPNYPANSNFPNTQGSTGYAKPGYNQPGYNAQQNNLGVPNSQFPGGSYQQLPQGYYNAQPNSGYSQAPQGYANSGYNTQPIPQGRPGSQRPYNNMQQNPLGVPNSRIPGWSNTQIPQGSNTQPNSGYYTQTPQGYGTSGSTPQGKLGYNNLQNTSGAPNPQYQGGPNIQAPQEYYDTQQDPQGISGSQINSRPGYNGQKTNPGGSGAYMPQGYESTPSPGNRVQNMPGTVSQQPGNNPGQEHLSNQRPFSENLLQSSLRPNQEYSNSQNIPAYDSTPYSGNSQLSPYFVDLPQDTVVSNQGQYFNDPSQRLGYNSLPYSENSPNSAGPNQGYSNYQLPYQAYQQGYVDSDNNPQSVPSLATQKPAYQYPVSNPEYSVTPNYQMASQQNQMPLAYSADQVNPNRLSNQQVDDGLQFYSAPTQYDTINQEPILEYYQ